MVEQLKWCIRLNHLPITIEDCIGVWNSQIITNIIPQQMHKQLVVDDIPTYMNIWYFIVLYHAGYICVRSIQVLFLSRDS